MKTPLRPIRRVMLIFPPMFDLRDIDTMFCPPLGIAYLGAFVRDMVAVKLLDAVIEGAYNRTPVSDKMELVGLSYDDILAQIRSFQPDLVGFSCIFSNQFVPIKILARRIKSEIDQGVVLVAGGTHPSFMPERTLTTTDLDFVVLGEGELSLQDLLAAHNNGGEISSIDGLAFRDGEQVRVNPRVRWVENLDDIPFPARDLLPMEKYFQVNVPMALHWRKRRNTSLISSRGCPNHCAYCSANIHWGNRLRYRSMDNVLAEIEHLRKDFGVEELKFQDDNLTLPPRRARQLFQGMIDRELIMPWNTPSGLPIWSLDEALIKLMKKSGCYEFTLAVESGDPWVLKNIANKPLKLEKAVEVARLARKHGLTTVGYFVIGFPGETMDQIRRTIRFAHSLRLDYFRAFIYNPLPGSPLWAVCKEKGYIPEDYHYEDANNYFQSDLSTEEFDSDALVKVQTRAYLRSILTLPFRNPKEFISYYGRMLLTRPGFLKTFVAYGLMRKRRG